MKDPQPPKGLSRLLWRLPIWFYRLKLGWLLGRRFLLIHHIGRKSGKPRQAVVEVARYDPATDTHYVCAGFGKQSDWYRNLAAHPEVTIQVGRRTLAATADLLSPTASGEEMVRYARENPKVVRGLMKVLGYEIPDSIEGYRQLAVDYLPFVAFVPHTNTEIDAEIDIVGM